MLSLKKKVFSSSALLLASKMAQRSIGLISTLILARLLVPEDFAIVAIASLFLYFFAIFSNTGSVQYICQKTTLSNSDLDTAWTIDLSLRLILFLIFIIATPYIATFYNNETLTNVLYLSATTLIFQGFISPGILKLKRELKYKKIFFLDITTKILSFLIIMAIIYYIEPTYWAIIIADVSASLMMAIGSYFIAPYKPKISLLNFNNQLNFSKWILGKGFIGYSRAHVDTFIISKAFTPLELGQYHIMKGFSILPATDIIAPAIEPLVVAFAQFKENKKELAYKFNLSILAVLIIISPISSFMFFYSENIVHVLLGEQWLKGHFILKNLSIMLFAMTIGGVIAKVFIATGKVKVLFWYDVFTLLIISSFLLLVSKDSIDTFSFVRALLEVFINFLLFIYLATIIKIYPIKIFIMCTSIFISLLLPYTLSNMVLQSIDYNPLAKLSILVIIYFTVFSFVFYCILAIMKNKMVEYKYFYDLASNLFFRLKRNF